LAIVSISKNVGESPKVAAGRYGDEGGVKVVTSEIRDVPGDNPDNAQWWDIGILIPTDKGGVFAHTQPFGPFKTVLADHSGSKAFLFARQLGIENPEEEFDTDCIMGQEVLADVKIREWEDRGTGEIQRRPFIADVFLK
jgi:hypothetical protein